MRAISVLSTKFSKIYSVYRMACLIRGTRTKDCPIRRRPGSLRGRSCCWSHLGSSASCQTKTVCWYAMLAIDPRYVTLSLEKHYHHILHPRHAPNRMDFLEKITQIPFRLPRVGIDDIGSFVDSQTEIEESQNASQNDEPSADTFDNLLDNACGQSRSV